MRKKAKKLGLVLLLLSTPFYSCEKNKSGTNNSQEANATLASENAKEGIPTRQPVPGQLVITAEVLEIPGSFPSNELYSYVYVMKYKVIKVVNGSYPDAEILVGHYNPRLARAEIKDDQDSIVGGNLKSFQVGDSHYLVLSPMESIWNGASEDDFFKDKQTRYWAFWTDKLK